MLGHRQPSTTQRYAHLADKIVRQALVVTTRSITDAINTIPALAEAPFEPLRDAQWSGSQPIVERTRGAGGVASDLRKIVDGIRWVLQRGVKVARGPGAVRPADDVLALVRALDDRWHVVADRGSAEPPHSRGCSSSVIAASQAQLHA
jgi:hypothetical protein